MRCETKEASLSQTSSVITSVVSNCRDKCMFALRIRHNGSLGLAAVWCRLQPDGARADSNPVCFENFVGMVHSRVAAGCGAELLSVALCCHPLLELSRRSTAVMPFLCAMQSLPDRVCCDCHTVNCGGA